jgi:hypothetical protein
LSDEEEAKRYHALIVNIKTGEVINHLPNTSKDKGEK